MKNQQKQKNKFETLEEKISDIYGLYIAELYKSRNFIKFIRIPLTEQRSLRLLDEKTLRSIYHYQSSEERMKNRMQKSVEEHAVPIKVIAEILTSQYLKDKNNFRDFIRKVLGKLLWITFITEEENRKLNMQGLKNAMPDGWDWEQDSPFVRYNKVGIVVSENL